jgi:hypothetical protein
MPRAKPSGLPGDLDITTKPSGLAATILLERPGKGQRNIERPGQRPRLQFSSFLIRERGGNGYSANANEENQDRAECGKMRPAGEIVRLSGAKTCG